MTSVPKVLLAEDPTMAGEGLRAMLHPDYTVVEVIQDGTKILPAIAIHDPDVLLLDLSLTARSGINVLGDVREHYPRLPIVIVSMNKDAAAVNYPVVVRALGYVREDSDIGELRRELAMALAGRQHISPPLGQKLTRLCATTPLDLSHLTPRQQGIVRLIGEGLRSYDIASCLGVSVSTVHFHRKNIARRLGLKGHVALMRYALLVTIADTARD